MKNENVLWRRWWRKLRGRWNDQDYPGAEPRFHVSKLAADLLVFLLLPSGSLFLGLLLAGRHPKTRHEQSTQGESVAQGPRAEAKSQIIEFRRTGAGRAAGQAAKVAPGALVRVRLLNVVETYSTAPVHAQIIDTVLGRSMLGGILIGDASPDTNFDRITINFRIARDPLREGVAFPISARALSLDGTFGLDAEKKEGFLARSAFGSAATLGQDSQGRIGGGADFVQILLRALTTGLSQEFASGTQVQRNRAQILTLTPQTEFFAELTDYFGGRIR